jgi:hypothetical protein
MQRAAAGAGSEIVPLASERVAFLSGKVTKAIGAGHDGLANVRLARLSCASRRARAGANSHIPVLGDTAIHGLLRSNVKCAIGGA